MGMLNFTDSHKHTEIKIVQNFISSKVLLNFAHLPLIEINHRTGIERPLKNLVIVKY